MKTVIGLLYAVRLMHTYISLDGRFRKVGERRDRRGAAGECLHWKYERSVHT